MRGKGKMNLFNIIEQDIAESKKIEARNQGGVLLSIHDDFGDVIDIDRKGAFQLIEILKEFVNENN